jgi:hypothetical protein
MNAVSGQKNFGGFTGAANGATNKTHTEFFTKVNEVNKGRI